jgi:hypothetical protein
MNASRPSGVVSRKLILWVAVPFVIVGLLAGCRAVMLYKFQRARAKWKEATLPQLAALSITNEAIRQELETLKAGPKPDLDLSWVHDHVLLMTNGDYLIYAFRHGVNDGVRDHLFLAHGSDGRWFYSTYHFCSDMIIARSDDAPGSLTEFAKRYWVREFDGKSDACLQHTWPLRQ